MQLSNRAQPIQLGNECIEEVNKFSYLGSIMSKDNATENLITSRLQKARSAFVQLNKVWKSRRKPKLRSSTAMYYLCYCTDQNVGGLLKQTVIDCQTSCLRTFCKLYWPARISNQALLERTKQDAILTTTNRRRWRWFGHVLREHPNNITRISERLPTASRDEGDGLRKH